MSGQAGAPKGPVFFQRAEGKSADPVLYGCPKILVHLSAGHSGPAVPAGVQLRAHVWRGTGLQGLQDEPGRDGQPMGGALPLPGAVR